MLIQNGTTLLAGPLDVVFIYHFVDAGTYHVTLYEESPMPGPIKPFNEMEVVRLKSSMHHTAGAPSFEEALVQLEELRAKVLVDDCNVFTEAAVPWSGIIGDVLVVPNWRKAGSERAFNLGGVSHTNTPSS